jgi:hypothetical protein
LVGDQVAGLKAKWMKYDFGLWRPAREEELTKRMM